MCITKDLDNKVFVHIDPFVKTLASPSCLIRYSYRRALNKTQGRSVFGIYIIFNLASISYQQVTTARKKRKVGIDNAHRNTS